MRSKALALLLAAVAAPRAPGQDEIRALGRIEPMADVVVKARVDGYASRVPVKPGDKVKALDELAVLSAPELQAEVGRATAALAQEEDRIGILEVELEIAKKRLAIAEREVKVGGEELPKAKETLTTREQELQQAQALFEGGRLGPQELAQARVQLAEARAAWRTAGERVKNAQDEVEIARLEVRRAELEIVRQRSRINVARAGLELAKIRAGFATIKNALPAATVTDVMVAPGSLVAAGETPLVRLMALDRVRAVCDVHAHQAVQIKPGNPVQVAGRHKVDAEVGHVATRIDSKGSTVCVEIVLDNADGRWQPGQRVQVVFHPRR